MKKTTTSFRWLLSMAWRDSRRSWRRLFLFSMAIIVGIAALVAIQSFSKNLQGDIRRQARSLLSADLKLEDGQPLPDTLAPLMDTLGGVQSEVIGFVSMAYFPRTQGTRLVYVQSVQNNFPLYGELNTEPEGALGKFREGDPVALADATIMLQFGLQVGDSVRLGQSSFIIGGAIKSLPGRAGIASAVAPVVLIPEKYLEGTGLVQRGSRVNYTWLISWDQGDDVDTRIKPYRDRFEQAGVDIETATQRQRGVSDAFRNLGSFLQLVGFVALLLGCIGVASGVQVYVKEKQSTVAILRCLGASGRQTFSLYVLQVGIISSLSAVIGVIAGSLLLPLLPLVFADFLPLQNIDTSPSWLAMFQGWLTGSVMALAFALLPLLNIRKVSPLSILRADFGDKAPTRDRLQWALFFFLIFFVAGVAWWQAGGMGALIFTGGTIVALGLLAGVARLLMWALRRFFPVSWSFPLRQGLANLFRPNNQTLTLLVTIGLGTALLAHLFLIRDILLQQVNIAGQGDRPSMILFDIQTPQKEGVAQMVKDAGMPLLQQVPIVTMRLESIDAKTKLMVLADSSREIRRWVFDHEYRVTYRDTLIDSEKIVEGKWNGQKPETGDIPVSLSKNVAEDMKAKIGTKLVFNVQGVPVETVVTSIREVDFARIQTNFLVVFPTGVLEKAPQFHVIVTRISSEAQSADFQQRLVQAYPNVSVVDLTQILRSVDDVLRKLSFVIRFMAIFSILTGLLVLVSALAMSRYNRIRESVLLRTLGAHRRQIMAINLVEYIVLGSLAAFTGLLLAIAGSWAFAAIQLKTPFIVHWSPILGLFAIVVGATVLIGVWTSRSAVAYPPLEVLRQEG